jgi:hypothetical protein
MATLRSFNDFVARVGNGFYNQAHFSVEVDTATSSVLFGAQSQAIQKTPLIHKLPTLPSGVTGYRLVGATLYSSQAATYQLVKLVNFGSLNIATPAFTAGVSMPTVTEGNISRQTSSPILAEVTTTLSATPGSLALNYVDQDGNASEAITAIALTGSTVARSCGFVVLNGTDSAAKSVSSVTRTGGTTPTGVVNLWGVVPYAFVTVLATYTMAMVNLLTCNPAPPLLGADDELYLLALGVTQTRRVTGTLHFIAEQS